MTLAGPSTPPTAIDAPAQRAPHPVVKGHKSYSRDLRGQKMGLRWRMFRAATLALLLPSVAALGETLSFDAGNPSIDFGNTGAAHYRVNGLSDPVLCLRSGVSYTIRRTSGSHPLVFGYNDTGFSSAVTYSGNLEAGTAVRQSPVLGNGDSGWLLRVAPNSSAAFTFPAELEGKEVFYYCEVSGHRSMIGKVVIEASVPAPAIPPSIDSLTLSGTTLSLSITGAPNASFVIKSSTTLIGQTFDTIEATSPALLVTDSNGVASFSVQTGSRPSLFLRVEQLP